MIFKELGIFDENYHQKYRDLIRQKRYKEYIENVKLDMYAKLFDARLKERIKKLIEEKFPKTKIVISDIPK
jgi:thymidylate kinase